MRQPLAETIYNLFQARRDVFAERWYAKKTKRSGYAPVCENTTTSVCKKFQEGSGGCKNCAHQKFAVFTTDRIREHLTSKKIYGIYPLLPDNTTWWLALDFDDHTSQEGKDPKEDALRFLSTCQQSEIPVYLERSRGGKGFHVWFFFDKPVPAWKARRAGLVLAHMSGVIPKAHDKSTMDRFIPNQDKLSGKATGTLICLPYAGQSEFLGCDGAEIEEQDDFLRSMEKVSEEALDALAEYAGQYSVTWAENTISPTASDIEDTTEENFERFLGPVKRCKFLNHCEENADHLPEPLWYAMITNLVKFGADGVREAHRISSLDTRRYNLEATAAKIEQAKEFGAPHTCQYLEDNGFTCPRREECPAVCPSSLGTFPLFPVTSSGNRYYRRLQDGGLKEISNFKIELQNTVTSSDGVVREVVLINDSGHRSAMRTLTPGDTASNTAFRAFTQNCGNYIFNGSADDVMNICRVFQMDAVDFIHETNLNGNSEGMWFFGNGAIDKQGDLHYADDNGVVWVKRRGYRIKGNDANDENSRPNILHVPEEVNPEQVKRLLETLVELTENPGIYLGLGWFLANFFSNELYKVPEAGSSFPFLLFYGKKGSGKSTTCAYLMKLFGYGMGSLEGVNAENGTMPGIERALETRASLPLWIDEWRNTDRCRAKEGMLRGIFNRSSATKAAGNTDKIKRRPVRGTLIVCGEVSFRDSALYSRCVVNYFTKKTEGNVEELLGEMYDLSAKVLPTLGIQIMQNKARTDLTSRIIAVIKTLFSDFLKEVKDARMAWNYALCLGTFIELLGRYVDVPALITFTKAEMLRNNIEIENEHRSRIFLGDVSKMIADHRLSDETDYIIKNHKLYLYMEYVHRTWTALYKDEDLLKKEDLIKDLKSVPFIQNGVHKRLAGMQRRFLEIDLTHDETPEYLKILDTGGE